MTIEQVKEEAKKRFDKDLTDEQAQAWLEAHPAGELQDEELADVAGGGCGLFYTKCPECGSTNVSGSPAEHHSFHYKCLDCGYDGLGFRPS